MNPIRFSICAIAAGLSALAHAQVSFFLAGNIPGGEGNFVNALSAQPEVFNFDSYGNLQEIDRVSPKIDISLVGPAGEFRSSTARIFFSGAFNTPGRVYQGAILPSTSSASGQLRLDFEVPVEGIGAWLFDDGSGIRNHARLTVIDTAGNSHTSDILDGNPTGAHGIEGFVGAVACEGIIAAIFESYDTDTSAWNSSHEIDNVHVGRELPAVLPILSRPCPGSSLTLTAQASGATAFQWRRNGVELAGENGPTLHIASVSGATEGEYDCIIDSGLGVCGGDATALARVIVCRADFNCDAAVDDSDFVFFVAAYNILDCADPSMPAGCSADLNGDGFVDDSDFVLFVAAYNALLCP
ncbi:MAG: hypothetical protein KF691_00710 [Phycisphaeraceae bacterium]|nr:hypothetical protein [Phycisphaeraceae bacterium]